MATNANTKMTGRERTGQEEASRFEVQCQFLQQRASGHSRIEATNTRDERLLSTTFAFP